MKRITLAQAVKEMQAETWTGKTIWAQEGTTEINIYRDIHTKTLERLGLCVDIVAYNEYELGVAKRFLESVEFPTIKEYTCKDEQGNAIFYTLNAR